MLSFYPAIEWQAVGSFVTNDFQIDSKFLARIKAAYRLSLRSFSPPNGSIWESIWDRNQNIHAALINDHDAPAMTLLSDPGKTDLFYGMDGIFPKRIVEIHAYSEQRRRDVVGYLCDRILRLAEAVGGINVWNPEVGQFGVARELTTSLGVEDLLLAIDRAIDARIDFPNPFNGEFGIRTSRGIASFRALQAVYQAWRLVVLARIYGERVLEIGGGTGRTVYYARRFGLVDYMIVDLPMANVAQALFLGRTLGPDAISLPGEEAQPGQIRIVTPAWLLGNQLDFDVVINVDSLTEMSEPEVVSYAELIAKRSRAFLSINHERNPIRVRDLALLARFVAHRSPYWMRKGYVEEFFQIGMRRDSPSRSKGD